VLNANVPCDELLSDLVASGFSHKAIAAQIGTELEILAAIEAKDFENWLVSKICGYKAVH
jgi:hypothetical protein